MPRISLGLGEFLYYDSITYAIRFFKQPPIKLIAGRRPDPHVGRRVVERSSCWRAPGNKLLLEAFNCSIGGLQEGDYGAA
jgi:hypothetical protein